MTQRTSLTTTEKTAMDGYLATIRQAAEMEEYEMAITAMESLKQIFLEKLMCIHHGDGQSQKKPGPD